MFNTGFQEAAALRQGALKFLRQNGGRLELPVSLFVLTPTGTQATQPTRDGNMLASSLEKLPGLAPDTYSAQGMDGLLLRYGRSVDALTKMTRYEATQPGRKLMIWLSAGWPMLSNSRFHPDPRNQNSYFRSIVELSTGLRESRVALYAIIPQDLNRGVEARADYYRQFLGGVASAKQADAADLSLQVLAEQSGGRVLGPTGDIFGAITSCIDDAKAFYEVTFDSAAATNVDTYHELKVNVGVPGARVRTNSGYYAEP